MPLLGGVFGCGKLCGIVENFLVNIVDIVDNLCYNGIIKLIKKGIK